MPQVAAIVPENWVFRYKTLDTILTDNKSQFVSSFSSALCTSMGTKLVTTTQNHLQSDRQVKRFNTDQEERICHYVTNEQKNWNVFL